MARLQLLLIPVFSILVLSLVVTGCSDTAPPISPAFPEDKPELDTPATFTLDSAAEVFQDEKVNIDSDIMDAIFENCEVWITRDDVTVARTEFRNSQVFVAERQNVSFNKVIFRDLNQYEKSALSIYDSRGVSVRNCQFLNNYIGLGIHSSQAEVFESRFEKNNGHNALVIGEGSSVAVRGNYFYASFPHVILIMNREDYPEAWVEISDNLISQTGEDAIDFEDYRGASPSMVSNNVITDTGWSAIIVEYNSWEADITIERNWIENTGIEWKFPTHRLQPDSFQFGWGHGILVEDSSSVSISENRIVSAAENGIEVKNSQDITIEGNRISCSQTGIGVHQYEEYSLHRSHSPVMQKNAGGSQVSAVNNVIDRASKDYDVDRMSELVKQ